MGILSESMAAPILPSHDLTATRSFYVEKLGLQVDEGNSSEHTLMLAGPKYQVFFYLKGKSKAEHTTLGFGVADVHSTVSALREKGVVFEEYDIPEMGLKTKDGVAEMDGHYSAWFKDPSDNILVIENM